MLQGVKVSQIRVQFMHSWVANVKRDMLEGNYPMKIHWKLLVQKLLIASTLKTFRLPPFGIEREFKIRDRLRGFNVLLEIRD